MADKMNGMDFCMWTQQRQSGGKTMRQHKYNLGEVHKQKQVDGTRWQQITFSFYI